MYTHNIGTISAFRKILNPTTADLRNVLCETVIKTWIKTHFIQDETQSTAFISYLHEKAGAKPGRMDAVRELLMFITYDNYTLTLKNPSLFEQKLQIICQKLGDTRIVEHMQAHLVSQGPYAIYARDQADQYFNTTTERLKALAAHYRLTRTNHEQFFETIHHLPGDLTPVKEWFMLFSEIDSDQQNDYITYLQQSDPDFPDYNRFRTELLPQYTAYISKMPRHLKALMVNFRQQFSAKANSRLPYQGTIDEYKSAESHHVSPSLPEALATLSTINDDPSINLLPHFRALIRAIKTADERKLMTTADASAVNIIQALLLYFNRIPPFYAAVKQSLLNAFIDCVVKILRSYCDSDTSAFKHTLCNAFAASNDVGFLLQNSELKKQIFCFLTEHTKYILNLPPLVQVDYFNASPDEMHPFQSYTTAFFTSQTSSITFEATFNEPKPISTINRLLEHIINMINVYGNQHQTRLPDHYQEKITALLSSLAACLPRVPAILNDTAFQGHIKQLLSYPVVNTELLAPSDMQTIINALQLHNGRLLRHIAAQFPQGFNSQYAYNTTYHSFAFHLLRLSSFSSTLPNEILAISDQQGNVAISWAFYLYLHDKALFDNDHKPDANSPLYPLHEVIQTFIKEQTTNGALTISGVRIKHFFDTLDNAATEYESKHVGFWESPVLRDRYIPETHQFALKRLDATQMQQYKKAIERSMDSPERKATLMAEAAEFTPVEQKKTLDKYKEDRDLSGMLRYYQTQSDDTSDDIVTAIKACLQNWLSIATPQDILVDIDDALSLLIVYNHSILKNTLIQKMQLALQTLPLEQMLIILKTTDCPALTDDIEALRTFAYDSLFDTANNARNQNPATFLVDKTSSRIAHEIGVLIKAQYDGIAELQAVIELITDYQASFNTKPPEEKLAIQATLRCFFESLFAASETPLQGNIMRIAVNLMQWQPFVDSILEEYNTLRPDEWVFDIKGIAEHHQPWFMDVIKLALHGLKRRYREYLQTNNSDTLFHYLSTEKATIYEFQRRATLLTELLKPLWLLIGNTDPTRIDQIKAIRDHVNEHKKGSRWGTRLIHHTELLLYEIEKTIAASARYQNAPLEALWQLYQSIDDTSFAHETRHAFFEHTLTIITPQWKNIKTNDIAKSVKEALNDHASDEVPEILEKLKRSELTLTTLQDIYQQLKKDTVLQYSLLRDEKYLPALRSALQHEHVGDALKVEPLPDDFYRVLSGTRETQQYIPTSAHGASSSNNPGTNRYGLMSKSNADLALPQTPSSNSAYTVSEY